jgi:hypothetical protein
MGMVEIIADFIKHGGNITNPHVRPICVLLLLKYISRETEIILVPHIPSSNQKGWTTTTSNVVRKSPKITQLEHRKKSYRVPLHLSTDKEEVCKKNMAVHPLSASTPAPRGRWWNRHRYYPGFCWRLV